MVVPSLKLGNRCPLHCNFHRQCVSLSERFTCTTLLIQDIFLVSWLIWVAGTTEKAGASIASSPLFLFYLAEISHCLCKL